MATKRTGLGRGIGALIPVSDESTRPVDVFFPAARDTASDQAAGSATDTATELVRVPGAHLAQLSPLEITPNPQQPRAVFDEEDLAELVHSIREVGLLQPIVVRPLTGLPGKKYELIMGERRLRASLEIGLATIPAIVKETADENMLRDALLENLHRSDLNPLEEASAYQQLMSDFGITQEELSARIGRSRSQIANTVRLLRLPDAIQKRVAAGVLSAGHARAILSTGSPEAMARLADKIVNEDLSVRAAEAAAGATGKARKPRPAAGKRRGHLDEVVERLEDRLNTRVKITLGASKGLLAIEFASVQDLNRILEELGESDFGAV